MLTYRISSDPNFETEQHPFYNNLIDVLQKNAYLSSSIDEIIISDNFFEDVKLFTDPSELHISPTIDKEFSSAAYILRTNDNDKIKIIYDADRINLQGKEKAAKVFCRQIIDVYVVEIIDTKFKKLPNTFHTTEPFHEVIEKIFSKWAASVIGTIYERLTLNKTVSVNNRVNIFVDSFKRKIKNAHLIYQKDNNIDNFWAVVVYQVNFFINRCIDVTGDEGTLEGLQEFNEIVPPLISEVIAQTKIILNGEQPVLIEIEKYVRQILNKCLVDVSLSGPVKIIIMGNPKTLFKDTLIDTVPRLVAFIDILGFSAIIKEYDSDPYSNMLSELRETLETAVTVSIKNIKKSTVKTEIDNLEYRMFSDCICLSIPFIEHENDFHIQFHSITALIRSYQSAMMQKGFFVRGGISMGSYYSDENMIFSGGLVNAVNIEKALGKKEINYPVIQVDNSVIKRLKENFTAYSKGLFYDKTLVHTKDRPDIIFVNPFEPFDNMLKNFDSIFNPDPDIFSENPEILNVIKSLGDSIKGILPDDSINTSKRLIQIEIIKQIDKFKDCEQTPEVKKVRDKLNFLILFSQWSIDPNTTDHFQYYNFK